MTVELSTSPSLARRAKIHAALGDPHRLRIVDLLALSDPSPSEIREDLGIGSNLLAHHVRILEDAGVVESLRSEGDGRRRYLRLVTPTVGDPSVAGELVADAILFVCTGNSARSQLAAAMWNQVSEIPAESAGTHPEGEVHARAVRAGLDAGVDLRDARPRAIEDVAGEPDLIVTVCDRAHEELGQRAEEATVLHWWIPDPRAIGSAAAFDVTVRRLRSRIQTVSPRVVRAERHRPRRSTHP